MNEIIEFYLKVKNVKKVFEKFAYGFIRAEQCKQYRFKKSEGITHAQIRKILLDAGVMQKVGNRNKAKLLKYENEFKLIDKIDYSPYV